MILHFTYIETVCRSMVMDTHKLCRAMEVWIYVKSDTYISVCMQAALSTLLKLWKSTNSMRAELETSALECAGKIAFIILRYNRFTYEHHTNHQLNLAMASYVHSTIASHHKYDMTSKSSMFTHPQDNQILDSVIKSNC